MRENFSMHAVPPKTTNMLKQPARAEPNTQLLLVKSYSLKMLTMMQPNAAGGVKNRASPSLQTSLVLLSHFTLDASGKKKLSPRASATDKWHAMSKEISSRT